MQEQDVAGLHERAQLLAVGTEDRFVVSALGRAERSTVAGRAVEVVVDALRDLEEPRVALDHHPPGVDADPPRVREQRLEHLGHAPTGCGRVHVDDGAAVQQLTCHPRGRVERGHPLGADHGLEACRVESADVDLAQDNGPGRPA